MSCRQALPGHNRRFRADSIAIAGERYRTDATNVNVSAAQLRRVSQRSGGNQRIGPSVPKGLTRIHHSAQLVVEPHADHHARDRCRGHCLPLGPGRHLCRAGADGEEGKVPNDSAPRHRTSNDAALMWRPGRREVLRLRADRLGNRRKKVVSGWNLFAE